MKNITSDVQDAGLDNQGLVNSRLRVNPMGFVQNAGKVRLKSGGDHCGSLPVLPAGQSGAA